MIINSFRKNGKPKITVGQIYKKSDVTFKVFIVTFSKRVIDALLADGYIEVVAQNLIESISCDYPVYRFKGTDIGIVKTTVGAPLTAALIEEVAWCFSCNKVVFFGSCGGLDGKISENKIIVPTYAYRDEGFSYHYLEPSDYIKIKNCDLVKGMLDKLNVPYVLGKTWTTDAFYRETEEEIEERKKDGCIAVEMEVSACQALCNYAGIDFYPFLYRADNLDTTNWDMGLKDCALSKDDRLKMVNVAFLIAKNIS